MLLDIRERVKGWLAYLIVILISIPFVLWGVGEYFSGGKDKPAAEVNGHPISQRALEQAISQQRAQLIQAFGGKIDAATLQKLNLRKHVLDSLIDKQVLNDFAHKAGFKAPNAIVAASIRGIPAFQTNGQFDKKKYESLIQRQGMTVAQFEAQIRQEVILQTLGQAIAASVVVTQPQIDQFVRLRDQQRDAGYIQISRAKVAPTVDKPTEKAMKAFFQEHAKQYQQPERVELKYVELSPKTLAGLVNVTDPEIDQAYQSYVESQKKQVQRSVRHILITVGKDASAKQVQEAKDKIEKIRQSIVDGKETFQEAAKADSQDPGSKAQGGDLGEVAPGEMVKPFEAAMDKLKVGEISQPVRTQFGWHLIEVYKEGHPTIKSKAEMHDKLVQQVREQGVEKIYYKEAEKLSNVSYEQPDSLVPAAEALGLKVQTSGWITRKSGQGIGSNEKVRKAAFSAEVLKKSMNSTLIELGSNHAVVVRVAKHEVAQPLPFDKVADQVEKQMHAQAVDRKLVELGKKIAAEIESGKSPKTVADAFDAQLHAADWIKHGGHQASMGAELVRAAFDIPGPKDDKPSAKGVGMNSGDEAVVFVQKVKDGDPSKQDAEAKLQVASQIRQDYAARVTESLRKALRDRAEVKINDTDAMAQKPAAGG